ncbi:uncharacterized protein BDV14DRAFT_199213 [Aspergillus stella-maris]|uniref:uncharacterized protein n=1 Tax=Aspergillus stella-maris TaxID=1810926 RepID=UPI003CCCE5EF
MTESQNLPDYVLNPNAVLHDTNAAWRYGSPPNYTKTRDYYERTKQNTHKAASLPSLVSNLVKNWEIEASFKTSLSDWRTINPETYTFSLNGGPAQRGEHMLRVGTYNALLTSNEYYDPAENDFEQSHKAFKRMMPIFAWEVTDVYTGPPIVVFRWRHWGVMRGDYVGRNCTIELVGLWHGSLADQILNGTRDGQTVEIKAHGGSIEIQGIVVAKVNDKLQLEKIDVWYDPMDIFRQIARENAEKAGEGTDCAGAGECPVFRGAHA